MFYYSAKIDTIVLEMSPCLKAIQATYLSVLAVTPIIMNQVSHSEMSTLSFLFALKCQDCFSDGKKVG